MKTRRGESLGGAGQASAGPMPVISSQVQEPSAIPTQQQRLLGQLKTAMLNLNKKFGNNVTTEVLNQMVGSLIFDQEELKNQSWRPEYSDIKIDVELSNPPAPQHEDEGSTAGTGRAGGPVPSLPAWFDFEKVSEIENAYFGPLFSMDDERWKMYISMRNDLIRIYEDHVIVNGGTFMRASEIRSRMHPKDDAAQIFELWRFLSQHKVINRGTKTREQTDSLNGLMRDSVQAIGSQSVKNTPLGVTNYNPVKCSNCGRECKFFCYKSIAPPPHSPEPTGDDLLDIPVETPDIPMPSDEGDPKEDVEMKQEEIGQEEEKYFCHDCTPAYFEKIPLRIFIDEATRDRIAHGEFEEVTKEDLRSFIVVPKKREKQDEGEMKRREIILAEKNLVDNLMNIVGGKKGGHVVASWDSYKDIAVKNDTSSAETQNANPLEILDPLLQEALSGAGQKIRGSVLIEQQVRNLIIGSSELARGEEPIPSCYPVSVDRGYEIVSEVFFLVHDTMKEPIAKEILNTPLFQHARKSDPYHFGILSLVYRIVMACETIKRRHLSSGVDLGKLEEKIEERVGIKKEFLAFLNSQKSDPVAPESPRAFAKIDGFKGPSIFQPEIAHSDKVVLSSRNPAQLNLVAL